MTDQKLSERMRQWLYDHSSLPKEWLPEVEDLEQDNEVLRNLKLEYDDRWIKGKAENTKLKEQLRRFTESSVYQQLSEENASLKEQLEKVQSAWIIATANLGGAEAEVKRLTPFEKAYTDETITRSIAQTNLKSAEVRLSQAQDAMRDFHCSTYPNFPDDAHFGSPKERTCAQYYLCEFMKKALGGDVV